jgi:hypothetical protein
MVVEFSLNFEAGVGVDAEMGRTRKKGVFK